MRNNTVNLFLNCTCGSGDVIERNFLSRALSTYFGGTICAVLVERPPVRA